MTTHNIGPYRIVGELGRGGMGIVYKAHEEALNRFVAIKVLNEHVATDAGFVERFLREAQSAARLNHPNIVQIYTVNEENGRHYFVMEYVAGRSLGQVLSSSEPIGATKVAKIGLQTASGLQAAHELGVIHRDIKPANLLIDDRGLVKIADFGLALLEEAASRLTATGMFMGTPGYLSPEQCLDQEIDHRTDIYSLGVTLFEALTGKVPFSADSPLALLRLIVEEEAPDIADLNPEADEKMRSIVSRMMFKDRDQRYASCGEVVADLQCYLEERGASGPLFESIAAPPPATDTDFDTLPTRQVEPTAPGPGAPARSSPDTVSTASTAALVVETSPVDEDRRRQQGRNRRLALMAIVVVVCGFAALVGAGLIAWQSGLLDSAKRPLDDRAMSASMPTPRAADAKRGATTGESPAMTPSKSVEIADPIVNETPARTTEQHSPTPAPSTSITEPVEPRPEASSDSAVEQSPDVNEISGEETQRPFVAPPQPDGTVIVAFGEPLLAGEAEAFFERAFNRAGILLVDESDLPTTAALFAGERAPTPGEVREALSPYARNLVMIRVEYLGERPLQYMGQTDLAFQARVAVVPIDLQRTRALAPAEVLRVEYTHLNAQRVVERRMREVARKTAVLVAAN
jgi:serine/threonine-protein kinase